MENTGMYSREDFLNAASELDSYIGKQKDYGMFELEDPVSSLVIGSAYIPALGGDHEVKDIDLFIPDKVFVESLSRCPGACMSNSSVHVVHLRGHTMDINETVEVFDSISQPLDFSPVRGHEVRQELIEQIDEPYHLFYDGEYLKVGTPSPEVFAKTKNPDTEYVEKYLEQFERIDELTGSELVENSDLL